MADNFGRIWFPYDQSTIKVGTALCFSVRAVSPSGGPLQYKVWTGERPNQSLVCDWGGPTCRLSASLPQGIGYTPYFLKLFFAIRTTESAHGLSGGACFGDDACDGVTWIQLTLS
jgi:hypothetical protein